MALCNRSHRPRRKTKRAATLEDEAELLHFLRLARPEWSFPKQGGRDLAKVMEKLKLIDVTNLERLVDGIEQNTINPHLKAVNCIPFSRESIESIRRQARFVRTLESFSHEPCLPVRQHGQYDNMKQLLSKTRAIPSEPPDWRGFDGRHSPKSSSGDLSRSLSDSSLLKRGGDALVCGSERRSGKSWSRACLDDTVSHPGDESALFASGASTSASSGCTRPLRSLRSPTGLTDSLGHDPAAPFALQESMASTHSGSFATQACTGEEDQIHRMTPTTVDAGQGNLIDGLFPLTLSEEQLGCRKKCRGNGTGPTAPSLEEVQSILNIGKEMKKGSTPGAKWSVAAHMSPLEQGEDMLREQRSIEQKQKFVANLGSTGLKQFITGNIHARLQHEARRDNMQMANIQQHCMNIRKNIVGLTNARRDIAGLKRHLSESTAQEDESALADAKSFAGLASAFQNKQSALQKAAELDATLSTKPPTPEPQSKGTSGSRASSPKSKGRKGSPASPMRSPMSRSRDLRKLPLGAHSPSEKKPKPHSP